MSNASFRKRQIQVIVAPYICCDYLYDSNSASTVAYHQNQVLRNTTIFLKRVPLSKQKAKIPAHMGKVRTDKKLLLYLYEKLHIILQYLFVLQISFDIFCCGPDNISWSSLYFLVDTCQVMTYDT